MTFLVVGESLVDLVQERGATSFQAFAAGSPFNVAVALSRLRHHTRLVTQIGPDFLGDLIRDRLSEEDIELAATLDSPKNTSIALARLDEHGSADYAFHVHWDDFRINPEWLDDVHCVHTGSLATALDSGAQSVFRLIDAAKAAGVAISFDPNVRPTIMPDRAAARIRAEHLAAQADLVKASDEDLTWLYPESDPISAAQDWSQRFGTPLVVVTRGSQGCVAIHNGQRVHQPAVRVPAVDTIGAGDTFTAGLLAFLLPDRAASGEFAALLNPPTLSEALAYAARAASVTCSRQGANPPTADDLGTVPV